MFAQTADDLNPPVTTVASAIEETSVTLTLGRRTPYPPEG
jgi:hypothetical protein